MALQFRQRIFVVLLALTAVPTALAVVGWALAVRTVAPSAGARVGRGEMGAAARQMVGGVGNTPLAPRGRGAAPGGPAALFPPGTPGWRVAWRTRSRIPSRRCGSRWTSSGGRSDRRTPAR